MIDCSIAISSFAIDIVFAAPEKMHRRFNQSLYPNLHLPEYKAFLSPSNALQGSYIRGLKLINVIAILYLQTYYFSPDVEAEKKAPMIDA